MTKTINALTTLIVSAILALVAVALLSAPAQAHESGEEHGHEESSQEQPKNEQGAAYKYVAQSGDSYTEFARKAVQTYGKVNNVSLSVGQIIYIETTLTQDADSPVLNLGDEKTIEESKVKEAIDKATKLSESQVTAWAQYAQYVNFNTDKVGVKQ